MKRTSPVADPVTDSTHSFVVRLWQEAPGTWRGSIRHVQSETLHGFTRLDQALRFIEQKSGLSQPHPAQTARSRFGFDFKLNRRTMTMFALAGSILLIAIVLVLSISGVRLDALTAFMGR